MKQQINELTRAALMLAVLLGLAWLPPVPIGIIPVPIVVQNLAAVSYTHLTLPTILLV